MPAKHGGCVTGLSVDRKGVGMSVGETGEIADETGEGVEGGGGRGRFELIGRGATVAGLLSDACLSTGGTTCADTLGMLPCDMAFARGFEWSVLRAPSMDDDVRPGGSAVGVGRVVGPGGVMCGGAMGLGGGGSGSRTMLL